MQTDNQHGPNGPSQPRLDQAYETVANPTDKEPLEESKARENARAEGEVAHRNPNETVDYSKATPTAMAQGIRGAGPGEETKGYTQGSLDRSQELDAAQMGAPGEGKVADAVENPMGASGGERGLETDLDRKKAEQAPARQKVQQEKSENFDVGGILGQRGGPANPVDKDNYPNSGE